MNGLERLTSADLNPAKGLLVYTSNQTGIHLKDLNNGTDRQITAGGRGEGSSKFSEDGSRIIFVSSTEAGRQVYLYDIDTEQLHQATNFRGPVMDPLLSPDGTKVLFSAPISAGTARDYSAEKVNELDGTIVIEDFGYKFDGAGYITPDDHMHLVVSDADTGECRRLTTGTSDYLHAAWCPDSRHILCISDLYRPKSEGLGYDLLKIDTETGDIERLTEGLWLVSYPNPVRPCVTPDGKYAVAGVLDRKEKDPEEKKTMSDMTYPEVYLWKIALDGSGQEKIFEPGNECYQCVQFPYNAGCGWGLDKAQIDENGEYVYFVSGWQGQGNLYRVPLAGGRGELVLGGKQVYNGLGRIRGNRMLLACSTVDTPETYFAYDIDENALTKIHQSAENYLAEVEIQHADDFFFDTADGEGRVHGWVLPPYGMEEGKKYPVLLYIHGGPHPFYTYGFTPEHLAFAAEGYGVIWCNPRGSSGYGWKHQDMGLAYDGHAYDDIMQFVDEACERYDWIDPERIGVTGGSYGGYMTNYIATHTDRFRAMITQRGVANDVISYANSDMHEVKSTGYDSFEDFLIEQIGSSAVAYAEKVCRPFLILHGADDLRCPVEGAHQLYTAVKDIHPDLPCKLVLFPHTGHGQATDPRFKGAYHREMTEWLRTYL